MSARRASAAALACILLGGFASPGPPQPQRLAEIPRNDFLAEGVAIAPDGALLVSGVQGRTVLRVVDGRVRPWLKGRAKGGLFGMAVDARRDRLWIAETAGPAVPGSVGPAATAVLEVRLSDGRIVARHPAPQDDKPHWIGDVILAKDGAIYATDSLAGELYRLRPGGKALERIAQTGLASLQGLTLGADGTSLILADYSTGLRRIDLASGVVGPPLPSGGVEVRGIDGLTRYGRDLIATQNGTSRHRVLRLRLSSDERAIESVDILAVGAPLLEDVSLGAVDRDRFVFVARSGWAGFDDKARPNGQPGQPSVIGAIALPPGERSPG